MPSPISRMCSTSDVTNGNTSCTNGLCQNVRSTMSSPSPSASSIVACACTFCAGCCNAGGGGKPGPGGGGAAVTTLFTPGTGGGTGGFAITAPPDNQHGKSAREPPRRSECSSYHTANPQNQFQP